MPGYIIEHKINTIARLHESFESLGFVVSPHQYDIGEGTCSGWIARTEVSARDVHVAAHQVGPELYNLVDKIAFVTQCYAVVAKEPFLIKRTDRRNEFFLRVSRVQKPVSLNFLDDQRESLKALATFQEEQGPPFRYLREAINTTSFYPRLAMLVAALEAIAGEGKDGKTDREYIRNEVLKDSELCDRIFKYGDGIRNQVLHGKKIDQDLHGDIEYTDEIYRKIVRYFNAKHGTKINTRARNTPRSFGDYRFYDHWYQPNTSTKDVAIELASFCDREVDEAPFDLDMINDPKDF